MHLRHVLLSIGLLAACWSMTGAGHAAEACMGENCLPAQPGQQECVGEQCSAPAQTSTLPPAECEGEGCAPKAGAPADDCSGEKCVLEPADGQGNTPQ